MTAPRCFVALLLYRAVLAIYLYMILVVFLFDTLLLCLSTLGIIMKIILINPTSSHYIAEDLPFVEYASNQFQTAAPMSLEQLCSAMSLLLEEHFKRGEALTSPEMTKSYLISKLAGFEREVFSCLHLDNQHAVITYEELLYGTIDSASAYPLEKSLNHALSTTQQRLSLFIITLLVSLNPVRLIYLLRLVLRRL